ncbi:hypothetical protein J4Q44_G00245400 [Coregonus suidteri]|uniref:Uncharacterized protein n=1 Tax=Coregonus suidteri TaxID=861788 RepID=A0AAN8LA63_9TELE
MYPSSSTHSDPTNLIIPVTPTAPNPASLLASPSSSTIDWFLPLRVDFSYPPPDFPTPHHECTNTRQASHTHSLHRIPNLSPNTHTPLKPAQGAEVGWGCCCTLGGDATPLSRYLGKVGHAARPLLRLGGLLNPKKPSDVHT